MGAKKKGGLANRLARMTDDERAKYLQRKADMEEEARRRKEQLVETFMKNKLRKEDAFSRLNLAKINQQWHQVMRGDKCKAMKEEVEYMRKWIDRIVILKNKTIKKLMEELDWQEELYGKNFSAHSEHIDKIIEFHNKNLDQLCKQYKNDRKLFLHIGATERTDFEAISGNEIELLKTIIHGQDLEAKQSEREIGEEYMKKTDEILSTYRTELSQMKKERERISCALWRQMSKVLSVYVQQTDVKRSHLAELRRLDTEGAIAISKNQQHIAAEQEQIEKLKHEYAALMETSEEQIHNLENTVKITTKRFFKLRKTLCFEINHDEKQLTHLTNISNKVITELEKIAGKGEQILLMIGTCRKLESEEEKVNRWAPFIDDDDIVEGDELVSKSSLESIDSLALKQESGDRIASYKLKLRSSWEPSGESISESSDSTEEFGFEGEIELRNFITPTEKPKTISFDAKETSVAGSKSGIFASKLKPKTSISKHVVTKRGFRQLKSEEEILKQSFKHSQEKKIFQISTRLVKAISTASKSEEITKKSLKIRPTKSALTSSETNLVLNKPSFANFRKPSKLRSSSAPKPIVDSDDLIAPKINFGRSLKSPSVPENNFEVLDKLEGLWWVYNKVEMDCMKIRKQKQDLMRENNKLKEIIKDVLEAAALGQSIPSAKSSSTSASRKRFILSAPLSSHSIL